MRFRILKIFMEHNSLDWSLLRSFIAVLDAGSLLSAAKKLDAQQPTLSRHISELENQLGVALFERTGRGVTPTAAALAIADAARQMEVGANAVTHALTRRAMATQGSVRISASQVAATYLLPTIIASLQREEPGIHIELVASNQISNLLRREADIALRMVRPEQSSLIARKLGDVPICAAAHEDYLAEHGTPKTPRDLLLHKLIGYDRDETITRGFAKLGVDINRENFIVRTDDQAAYGRLVASGAGIGFVAQYNLGHWPGVKQVLPALRIPPLPCWLVVHREIRGNAIVRRVFDHLVEGVREAISE
jgi:DNA-binding transcriptional LysR family regulator